MSVVEKQSERSLYRKLSHTIVLMFQKACAERGGERGGGKRNCSMAGSSNRSFEVRGLCFIRLSFSRLSLTQNAQKWIQSGVPVQITTNPNTQWTQSMPSVTAGALLVLWLFSRVSPLESPGFSQSSGRSSSFFWGILSYLASLEICLMIPSISMYIQCGRRTSP